MATRASSAELTGDEFMTGLLAAIAWQGVSKIEAPPVAIEEAVVAAFESIEEPAEQAGVRLRFHLGIARYSSGSGAAYSLLNRALRDGLFTTESPGGTMHLRIERSYAPRYLERLPLDQDTFMIAATAFLEELPHARVRAYR